MLMTGAIRAEQGRGEELKLLTPPSLTSIEPGEWVKGGWECKSCSLPLLAFHKATITLADKALTTP